MQEILTNQRFAGESYGHCKDCKWWERHTGTEGFCRQDSLCATANHFKIEARPGMPRVWAKGDWVRTKPDFGCVDWIMGPPTPRRKPSERTDAERVDWLSMSQLERDVISDIVNGFRFNGEYRGGLREAIDAAMDKEFENG